VIDLSKIVIRRGVFEDAPHIKEFTKNTFHWGDYVGDAFTTWLQEPGDVWVAELSGKPVGVTHVFCLSREEVWFEGIRVHPAFRRMGIGRLLTKTSIAGARARGARVARCAIDSSNQISASMARSAGFEQVGTLVEYFKKVSSRNRSGATAPGKEAVEDSVKTSRLDGHFDDQPNSRAILEPEEDLKPSKELKALEGLSEHLRRAFSPKAEENFVTVRDVRREDTMALFDLAKGKVKFVEANFRWKELTPENLCPRKNDEKAHVAVDRGQRVIAYALTGKIWVEPPTVPEGLTQVSLEVGTIFGKRPGITAILRFLEHNLENWHKNMGRTQAAPDPTGIEYTIYVYLNETQLDTAKLLEELGFAKTASLEDGNEGTIGIWELVL